MDRINNRNVKFFDFEISTNWASKLPTKNWLAIILTKSKDTKYFDDIIRKIIDRNVGYICSIGEQQDLFHDMADEEITYRKVAVEPHHLPQHMIMTTGHDELEDGIWFGLFSAYNDECEIKHVAIINVTNDPAYFEVTSNIVNKFRSGYIPN